MTDTNINPPSPVILETTAEGDFICKDKPLLYSFSCTLYGFNLIWYFDNEILTAFQANDMDHLRTFQYPSSAPIYNITVVLTQVSTATVSRFNAPFCVSVLTVQPFNENEIQVLPFAVSCQTHCEDANNTAVCQTKHYNVAGMYYKFKLFDVIDLYNSYCNLVYSLHHIAIGRQSSGSPISRLPFEWLYGA